jgi:hypothetical protein
MNDKLNIVQFTQTLLLNETFSKVVKIKIIKLVNDSKIRKIQKIRLFF